MRMSPARRSRVPLPEGFGVGVSEGGSMKFVIYADSSGKYRWRLVSGNGQTVGSSGESFDSRANARRAAENVRDSAGSAQVEEQ